MQTRHIARRSSSVAASVALLLGAVSALSAMTGCDGGSTPDTAATGTAAPATPTSAPAAAAPAQAAKPAPTPAAAPASTPAVSPTGLILVTDPAPPPAPQTPTGPAQLQFVRTTYPLGSMRETQHAVARMSFTNTGGEPLQISEIKTSCGCTSADLPKMVYAPGESGELEVSYSPKGPGDQRQYVNVFSNATNDNGMTRLMIRAQVEAFMEIEPRMIELGVIKYRESHERSLTVTGPGDDFEILSATTSNPHVTAVVRPVAAGASPRTRQIGITVGDTAKWGTIATWLEITATGKPKPNEDSIRHSSRVRIQGKIFGEILAEPEAFRFGVKPGESFTRTVKLRRMTGDPFTVVNATLECRQLPDAELVVVPISPTEYELIITSAGRQQLGQIAGRVVVQTDVPGEEEFVMTFIGVVRTSPGGVR